MTEFQGVELLALLTDLIDLIRIIGFGLWGVGLALIFSATWRG